jgi:transcriptional regulator with XRE-family HTH domain
MTRVRATDIRNRVAQNLRRLRIEKGWSQTVLAERADVDRTYVSGLERGVSAATVDMLARLGAVLGVEPVVFLQEEEKKSGKPLQRIPRSRRFR